MGQYDGFKCDDREDGKLTALAEAKVGSMWLRCDATELQ